MVRLGIGDQSAVSARARQRRLALRAVSVRCARARVVSCVYWAEDVELGKARLDRTSAIILQAFAQRGKVRRIIGVQVDTLLMAWHCQPDTSIGDRYQAPYLQRRGMVDDHLQRIRCGPRGSHPAREDALPRCGYVEVIVDDYQ
jgi:hypothetical protein